VTEPAASKYVPTCARECNDENAPEFFLPPASFPYGAAHTPEFQYLFDIPITAFPGASAKACDRASAVPATWCFL